MPQYALGLDFGTNSARALVVDCSDGTEVGEAVANYVHGDEGVITDPTDPNLARQEPWDYFDAMHRVVSEAVGSARQTSQFQPSMLVGIGTDTTGSTPMPTKHDGMPLTREPQFENNLNAKAWLWKDHSSHAEAEEITDLAKKQGRPYLAKCGGRYSSEWFWSKVLRAARISPDLLEASFTWIELCDFIPAHMCFSETTLPRSICAAGHKAMYSDSWGGLPALEFLQELHPALAKLRERRLYDRAVTSDQTAGFLSKAHAEKWGTSRDIPVAVGTLDAHAGAVGSGVAPGRMVKIIGTSTCDILVGTNVPDIPGVSGIVEGSVIPGLTGIEAGQSAVGDIFAWWSRVCGLSQEDLTKDATRLKSGQSGLLALDWNNGNRNVLADHLLTGLLVGQTLHTTAAEIYRALIEATAFGALKIINRIQEYGVEINEVVACGGIAEKSPLTMQIYADVLNRPIRLSKSAQAPALGAAIFGSVVGKAHPDVPTAQAAMAGFKDLEYKPDLRAAEVYRGLFRIYGELHDEFSHEKVPPVMKELLKIKKLNS